MGRRTSPGIFNHSGLGFVTCTASPHNKLYFSSAEMHCCFIMHFLSELPGVAVMATTLIPSHLPITTQSQATHTLGVTHFWKESVWLQVSMCHLRNKPLRAMPILYVLSKPVIKYESAKWLHAFTFLSDSGFTVPWNNKQTSSFQSPSLNILPLLAT